MMTNRGRKPLESGISREEPCKGGTSGHWKGSEPFATSGTFDPSGRTGQQVLYGDRSEGIRRKAMAHVQDLYSNETLLVIEVDGEPVVDLPYAWAQMTSIS